MTPNEYQQLAKRTLKEELGFELTKEEMMMVYNAIGLGGESGEALEVIKKGIFHRHGLDRDKLKYELGDQLWYIAALATENNLTMEEIMEANIQKLKARYPEGFSTEASRNRKESK